MKVLLCIALASIFSALLPSSALADASAGPDLEGKISMVRGQPIFLPPLKATSEIDEVRVAVDGRSIQTDDFPPFEDIISTRRFDRLGFQLEVEHTLTQKAFTFDGTEVASADYPLFIHPLPVIPRVHVFPMVVKKRTHLVGFQLRGIRQGSPVRAWGHGFIDGHGLFAIPLRLRKALPTSRTYVVPGGLSWRRGNHPHLIFSIGSPRGELEFGFQPRGRVFTGFLRTKRNGDTAIRQTDRWKRCAYNLTHDGRPPQRASCVYLL